jgi:hypothetical protein
MCSTINPMILSFQYRQTFCALLKLCKPAILVRTVILGVKFLGKRMSGRRQQARQLGEH